MKEHFALVSRESERYIHKRANPLGKFETWVRAGEYLHVHKNRIIVVNLHCNNRLLAQSLSSSTCDSCAKRNPHIPGNMVTYKSLSQVPSTIPGIQREQGRVSGFLVISISLARCSSLYVLFQNCIWVSFIREGTAIVFFWK